MKNKVAVITGAASGMGEATAGLFAAEGAHVVASDINVDDAEKVADRLRAMGLTAESIGVDVTSEPSVHGLKRRVREEFGYVDVLVNCAGVSEFGTSRDFELARWERVLAVNLTGVFLTCRELGDMMVRRRQGKIVNVASTAGLFGVPRMVAYTAAKHAVVGLTRSLAIEWAKYNVQVNCVCPGATETRMLLTETTPAFRAARVKRIPSGRFGTPLEQAQAILYLASDDASYVTGCVLTVDGGVAALAPATSDMALEE